MTWAVWYVTNVQSSPGSDRGKIRRAITTIRHARYVGRSTYLMEGKVQVAIRTIKKLWSRR